MKLHRITPEQLAQKFHELYENKAPIYDINTKPWENVPDKNKQLMCAVARDIINWLLL